MTITQAKVTVAATGTPQPVLATALPCFAIHFQAITGETGKIAIGSSAVRVATLVGTYHLFWPTGAGGGQPEHWDLVAPGASGNPLDANKVYVDAQVNGESVIATVFTR